MGKEGRHPIYHENTESSQCTMGTTTRRKDLYLLPSLKSAWPMHRILVSFSFSFSKFEKKTLYFPQKGVSPVSLHFLVFRHRHYWTYSLNGKHVSGS